MSSKIKIYIAGKITDGGKQITQAQYNIAKAKFELAKEELRAKGYHPVSPFDIIKDKDIEWEVAMGKLIPVLLKCEGTYFLQDWKSSKGARIEFAVAVEAHKMLFHQSQIGIVEPKELTFNINRS